MSEQKPIVIEMDFTNPIAPKTLDDVNPYVACVDSEGDVLWKDDEGDVMCIDHDEGKCFYWGAVAGATTITRVLGPIKFNIKL